MMHILICICIYVASVFLSRWIFLLDIKRIYNIDIENIKTIKKLCNSIVEDNIVIILFPVVNTALVIITLIAIFLDKIFTLKVFVIAKKLIASFIDWFLCRK